METVIDKVIDRSEWKKRVNSLKYVPPYPYVIGCDPAEADQVHIVIYSDMSKRHIKGVFKNINDAQDYKERLEKAVKKRSIYQKVLMTMAGRHETIFIETHIVITWNRGRLKND